MAQPPAPFTHLFRPCRVGQPTMKNRMVMAPLTRCRADDHHVPRSIMAEYYGSRASMGMLITESVMVQRNYSGYAFEPGLYSAEQVEAWRTVTEAVHARGGLIAVQLYHPGRATVPANITSDKLVIMGPSAHGIPPAVERCMAEWSRDGVAQDYPQHVHAMSEAEIHLVVDEFVRAARNAIAAGFDAVELHAGAGFLIDQFLRDGANQRTDAYGGSIENRCRFLFEVVDAVLAALPPKQVGVRLSPLDTFNGQSDSDPEALTTYVCAQLDARKIAFIDVVRGDPKRGVPGRADSWVRRSFGGVVMASHGYATMSMAEAAIADEEVDAVLFGVQAIANPDLVWRVLSNTPLQQADPATFFTRGIKGYIDYPVSEPRTFADPHVVSAAPRSKENSLSRNSVSRRTTMSLPAKERPYFAVSQPLLIGVSAVKNRIVMGPMPRQRCDAQQCPTPMMTAYYARRATYGLIISEPCEVQPGYCTYVRGAGISTKAQVTAWRGITDAVHAAGGLMFCQLHHGGRAVLACNLDGAGARAVGPTAQGIPATTRCPAAFAADGRDQPYAAEVEALSVAKLGWIVKLYVAAAKNAMLAGFDGVEIHAGGGYLIDQFLRECSNTRTDDYGGDAAKRCRLLDEVVEAVAAAVGRLRVGVRISPTDLSKGMKDGDKLAVTEAVAKRMGERKIAYLTLASGSDGYFHGPIPSSVIDKARSTFPGVLMCDDNICMAEADDRVRADTVQGVCVTLDAISNPDIMQRAIHGVAAAEVDMHTLFTHDAEGYDGYPTVAELRQELRASQVFAASASMENSTSLAAAPNATANSSDRASATFIKACPPPPSSPQSNHASNATANRELVTNAQLVKHTAPAQPSKTSNGDALAAEPDASAPREGACVFICRDSRASRRESSVRR